jgi:ribosomal protein L29
MPKQLKSLTNFYKEHYKSTVDENEKLYYDKLSYILPYEAIDMITNIENNIKEHFVQHLNKLVNINYDVYNKLEKITKDNEDKEIRKKLKKELYDKINKVKYDLLSLDNEKKSANEYHEWINQVRKNIIPKKEKYDKNSILYDIKSNTIDYLKSFIYLGIEIEKFYNKEEKDTHKIRLFNVLPLRTNIIAKNIIIDTCGLIQNFLGDEPTKNILKTYKEGKNQEQLWERIFKTNKRVFKKNK